MTTDWSQTTFLAHQSRVYSQNGEDGVLTYLLWLLKEEKRLSPLGSMGYIDSVCFEVGASLVNGNLECNTAILRNNGWQGVIIDREEIRHPLVVQREVTVENINQLIMDLLPRGPSVVSIDTDGIDYWLWKSLSRYPAIVIIEYNAHIQPEEAKVIPYDPSFRWDGSDYFGASARAMIDLGHRKGYRLVTVVHQLNMFFLREDLVPVGFKEPSSYLLGPIHRHPTNKTGKYLEL